MRARVLKVLEVIDNEILSYDGQDMVGDGIIDSFQVIDIVEALEREFQIELDAEYITADNFANKDSIFNLMEKIVGDGDK